MSQTSEETMLALRTAIDDLASDALQADGSDLQELARLHGQCQEIAAHANEAAAFEAAQTATRAADLIEALILSPTPDTEGSLAQLSQLLCALQAAVDPDAEPAAVPPAPQDADTPATAEPPAAAPAPVITNAAPAAPSAALAEGNESLLADFVSEAQDHLALTEVSLLRLESQPDDEEALNAIFRAFHTIKGVAGFLGLGDIGRLAHAAESLLDKARQRQVQLRGTAIDVVFAATALLRELVGATESGAAPVQDPTVELDTLLGRLRMVTEAAPQARLGELLVNSGLAREEAVSAALSTQGEGGERRPLGEALVLTEAVQAKTVVEALRTQEAVRGPAGGEPVKVDAARLDKLIDTIGELVVATSMVKQASADSRAARARLTQLEKITRELHDLGTSLRMVPVKPLFQRVALLVRELSKKSGKQVELVTVGEDTELDKTVIDRIGDPLLHMIRNAIDHGLEATAEDRLAAGKPERGRIELRAFHQGGRVFIEVEDDGRGLNQGAILSKALANGLIDEDANLSEADIFKLIFEPGFSTAAQVTEISGRGVGMDVVKRNVEALRGAIEIRSTLGAGSMFSIRLPLTMAIIDGMSVRVGTEQFIVPTPAIVTTIRPTAEHLCTVVNKGEMLRIHGRLLPLFRLGDLFGVSGAGTDPTESLAVVVEDDQHEAAMLVDELLAQQQYVLKSLGGLLQGTPGIAGGAVLGDGRVGLILDVAGLLRVACNGGSEQVRKVVRVA